MITDLTTKSALKKAALKKSLCFHLNLLFEMQFLGPYCLITFRMCHEFGAF